MNSQVKRVQRRGWLIAVARYLAVAGIGLLSWNLVRRSPGSCLRLTLPCQDCSLLAACRLPRARSAQRQEQQTRVDTKGVTP
jgi:hypothetical protein